MVAADQDVLARVRELVPDLRAAAQAGEQARAIPRESVEKMLDAGGLLPDESGKPEWSWFLIPAEEYEVVDMPIAAYGPLGFSTTILGAAQGALEEFRDWTESRLAPDGSRVAERPRIHRALAELAANIDAAELLLRRTLEVAQASTKPDSSLRARSLRDFAHAAQLGISADNNYSHWGRVELGLERAPGMVIY